MKPIIFGATVLAISIASVSAFADITAFLTVAQAEQNCPPVSGLTFTATNPKIPNGAGTIAGFFNTNFKNSQPKPALAPLDINDGIIQNVTFRQDTNGWYGFISGKNTACFYSYAGFTGVNVSLVMSTESTP